ncbi:MAG: adenylate/guanylate cyclase domain-containing protein [Rhodospirillales bacterium]|nr:adenylate/guanylate cyclase domain-containing protein [Rhodospirillales bacterium]
MERPVSVAEGIVMAAGAALLALAAVEALPPLAAADRFVEDVAVARLAPPLPQHAGIAIVAITEDTLARLPYRSPLDRGLVAEAIAHLRIKGARAIGLDLLIDQPTEPAKDAALRAALTAPGAPVIALAAGLSTPLTPRQRAFHDAFLSAVAKGHGNLAKDRLDGVVRRHVPSLDGLPSFPAALAATQRAAAPPRTFTIAWRRTADGSGPFPVYPVDALAFLPEAWLAGKIVLIGYVVPDADRHRAPPSVGAGPLPGVEIQAQVLAQILDGRSAPQAGWPWRVFALLLVAGGGAALALAGWRPAWLAPAALGGLAALWAAAAASVALGGPLLSPLAPSLAWLGAIGGASALAAVRERRTRTALGGLFAAHLSAPVAEQIWRERNVFLRGGRPRPQALMATVLFSDVEGFTPASEALGPERLMAWLEEYMEAMTDVVVAHDGVVLRFIGDGILAAFGVPIPRRDPDAVRGDARRSVDCALAMEDAVRRLNATVVARGLPAYRVRVGIVTGPMVGGSIGARKHLEYTLMGDSVNTAARLEALAKTVEAAADSPCRILVGASTWDLVGDAFEGQTIGEVALKGKRQRVGVYQIFGRAGAGPAAAGRAAGTAV